MGLSSRGSRWAAGIVALAGIGGIEAAEPKPSPPVNVPTIEARAEDVGSIDGMVKAYYEVISGPAGQPREWGRDRTLYIPDLRFVATGADKTGKTTVKITSHQQYVDSSDAGMVREGFDEREIHRVTERFGNIAHVFSTYETRKNGRRAGHWPRNQLDRALLGWEAVVDCLGHLGRRASRQPDSEGVPALGQRAADQRDILVIPDPLGGPHGPHGPHRDARRRPFGEKTECVMGFPTDLTRLRPEKVSTRSAPPAPVKNSDGYDGPSDGYDRSHSGYDGRGGSRDQSKDRLDGPEKGYDGPDQAHGGARPSTPVRR